MRLAVQVKTLLAIGAIVLVFFSFASVTTPNYAHALGPVLLGPVGGVGGESSDSDDEGGGGFIANLAGGVVDEASKRMCGDLDFFSCMGKFILYFFVWGIQILLLFVGVGGVILDVSLWLSFNMGAILSPASSAGAAVALGWVAIRDLVNLIFIAGLIWASIAMILQMGVPGGNAGKFIANLIIAALLVNFSYFFAGAAIDVSNTISQRVYEQGMLAGESTEPIQPGGTLFDAVSWVMERTNVGDQALGFIGSRFIYETKLASFLSPEELNRAAETNPTFVLLFHITLSMAFLVLTIEIFFSMAFAIIARFVILILLLITSPLLILRFVGIEPLVSWGKHWWKQLTSQLIFLPVFVFLISISFTVTGGFLEALGGSDLRVGSVLSNPNGEDLAALFGLILFYFIAYGMLKFSLSISKSLSTGETAKLPDVAGIQKLAGQAGSGVGGFLGRVGSLPRSIVFGGVGKGIKTAGQWGEKVRSQLPIVGTGGVGSRLVRGFRYSPEERYLEDAPKRRSNAFLDAVDNGDSERAKSIWDSLRDDPKARADIYKRASRKQRKEIDEWEKTGKLSGGTTSKQSTNNNEGRIDTASGGTQGNINDVSSEQQQTAALRALVAMERQDLREARRANRQANRIESKELAAIKTLSSTPAGVEKIKEQFGSGGLGELPVDLIINNNNVLNAMDEHDLATIQSRDDVTPDEYRKVRQDMQTTNERRGVIENHDSSPSSIADDET